MSFKAIVFSLLLCSCIFAFGQNNELDTVVVFHKSTQQINTLTQKELKNWSGSDLGQILPMFPGIQLKSYGGIGGLKTVSFQSLSANHTQIIIDNLAISSTQTGQTDVGNYPTESIEKIEQDLHPGLSLAVPIRAKNAGHALSIQTKLITPDSITRKIIQFQFGSFGLLDGSFFFKKKLRKIQLASFFKVRNFKGNFPFLLENNNLLERVHRINADLNELNGSFAAFYPLNKNAKIIYTASIYSSNKGLPGAVVFYNSTGSQRLNNLNFRTNLRLESTVKKWFQASQFNIQFDSLTYIDPDYLNKAGILISRNQTQEIQGSSQWKRFQNKHQFLVGLESKYEKLNTSNYTLSPQRMTTDVLSCYNWNSSKWSFLVQNGLLHVFDKGIHATSQNWSYLPEIKMDYKWTKELTFSSSAKRTVRFPTFSELYYQQVGNVKLEPEKAYLFQFLIDFQKASSKTAYHFSLQPFYVFAENRIQTLPTKNLFVWSVVNIGKSEAKGFSFFGALKQKIQKFSFSERINYTFQHALDLTPSVFGVVQKNDLTYAPRHTGTIELSMTYSGYTLAVLTTYQGERYVLPESKEINKIPAYTLVDLALSGTQKIKHQQINWRLSVNNCFNINYNYIRYFVMPGINYSVQLTYVF